MAKKSVNNIGDGDPELGLHREAQRSGIENYEYIQNRICDLLKHNPRGLTVSEMSRVLGMSRNSIGKYTDLLTLAGRVEIRAVGKAKLFYLSHRVPVSELLNFSSDAIIVMEENYNILQLNENARRLFKLSETELLGKNAISLLQQQARIKPAPSILYRPLQISAAHEIELVQDQLVRSMRVKIIPTVTQSGKPGIIMILEDVSNVKKALDALRESEQRYRSLIEAAPSGIITTDVSGVVSMANPMATRMHRYTSPGEMVGLDVKALIDPSSHQQVADIERRLSIGDIIRKNVIRLARKDGSSFPAEISASVVKSSDGKPSGMLIFSSELDAPGPLV